MRGVFALAARRYRKVLERCQHVQDARSALWGQPVKPRGQESGHGGRRAARTGGRCCHLGDARASGKGCYIGDIVLVTPY